MKNTYTYCKNNSLIILLFLMLNSLIFAQSSSALEFTSGAGNPTGNGPTVANQVITFQNNTDNPTGNAFVAYSPTTTATFSLTNQQRTMLATPNVGVMFGGGSSTSTSPVPNSLFGLLTIGAPPSSSFTSANAASGTGIDVNVNRGVYIYVTTRPLEEAGNPLPTTTTTVRYQFADMVITFNQPVNNPIIHFGGAGTNIKGASGNSILTSVEFDLITPSATLTRLSGSNEFFTSTTSITNSASQFDAITGNGGMSGSVMVNGSNLTTVTFRIYLKAQDNESVAGNPLYWADSPSFTGGDVFAVGVSLNSACNAGTVAPVISEKTN